MEKPILFNTEMVRAVLDGRKTQTRRVVKIPKDAHNFQGVMGANRSITHIMYDYKDDEDQKICSIIKSPYGKVGDGLWVRETWALLDDGDFVYKAAWPDAAHLDWCEPRWKPSIHMSKAICRLRLKVKDIKVERVQDITVDDIYNEGLILSLEEREQHDVKEYPRLWIQKWKALWDSINKKRGFGWDLNCWVWVIEFEVIQW